MKTRIRVTYTETLSAMKSMMPGQSQGYYDEWWERCIAGPNPMNLEFVDDRETKPDWGELSP